jgi:hypothetical protein
VSDHGIGLWPQLTRFRAADNFIAVQLTIEIPDDLAKELGPEREHIAEVIRRGLAQPISAATALAEEVIEFLGRGPGPQEIIGFRPSQESVRRAAELLEKNRESTLTPDERAEIEEICAWNRVFALIKAQARLHLQAAS